MYFYGVYYFLVIIFVVKMQVFRVNSVSTHAIFTCTYTIYSFISIQPQSVERRYSIHLLVFY